MRIRIRNLVLRTKIVVGLHCQNYLQCRRRKGWWDGGWERTRARHVRQVASGHQNPAPGTACQSHSPVKRVTVEACYRTYLLFNSFFKGTAVLCKLAVRLSIRHQCSGSMTFWRGSGSGSADPCLWLMDPDPDSAPAPDAIRILLFSSLTFKMPPKNDFFKTFFCIVLFEGTFTSFFKDKTSKRSHKTVEIKVFLTIFA